MPYRGALGLAYLLHCVSSLPSPQSLTRSHTQIFGLHKPLLQENWSFSHSEVREMPWIKKCNRMIWKEDVRRERSLNKMYMQVRR